MTEIKGKAVLLTGASRGIGPLLAEAFVQKGAHVALTARSKEGLQQTAEKLHSNDSRVMIFPTDLSQPGERRTLVESVLKDFGPVDILVNNAGIESAGPFLDLSWEAVQENIEVNLLAPMELTHLLLPSMLQRKSGHVVQIASIAAKSSLAFNSVYSASKSGLARWTEGLRMELEGSGVHFSTICPGFITETGMFADWGADPFWLVGSCTPKQVVSATLRAIEKNKLEVLVNSTPQKPLYVMDLLFPGFADWFLRKVGVIEWNRKKLGLPKT